MKEHNYEFQKRAFNLIKSIYPDQLVLQNTCAKGISHSGEEFPSIPIRLKGDTLDLYVNLCHQKHTKTIVHKPDIGVINFESVHRVYLNKKSFEHETADQWRIQFEAWGNEGKLLNKKGEGYLISIFDSQVEPRVTEKWMREGGTSKHFAIILKKGHRFVAVADAKNYVKSALNRQVLNKLIIDASLLAAENCFIITPGKTKVPESIAKGLEENPVHDTNIKIYRNLEYVRPELFKDRKECRNLFMEAIQASQQLNIS
jgi:hypothetical protein